MEVSTFVNLHLQTVFSLVSRKSEVVDCFCKLLAHFSSSRYHKDYKFDRNGKED